MRPSPSPGQGGKKGYDLHRGDRNLRLTTWVWATGWVQWQGEVRESKASLVGCPLPKMHRRARICARIHAYMHTQAHTPAHTHIFTHRHLQWTYALTHRYTHAHALNTHTHICTHAHRHRHMYTHAATHMCTHMQTHTVTYMHMYSHMCTHICTSTHMCATHGCTQMHAHILSDFREASNLPDPSAFHPVISTMYLSLFLQKESGKS